MLLRRTLPGRERLSAIAVVAGLSLAPPTLSAQLAEADEKPELYPDDTFISINGRVDSIEQTGFVLDYGDGEIVVEADAQSGGRGIRDLSEGDRVDVYGIVDAGMLDERKIQAAGVYVERLDATIRFDSTDDADDPARGYPQLSVPPEPFASVVTGTVTAVDRSAGRFTLAAGDRNLEIALEPGARTLLEDVTPDSVTLEVGDRIEAAGRIDEGFFGDARMTTDSVRLIEDQDENRD